MFLGEFVFGGSTSAPPSYRNACRALAASLEKAKVEWDAETERLSFHGLRHGAVSAMIRAGVDPVRIASFVGDRVQTILSTYSHEWQTVNDENLGDILGDALSVSV